MGRTARAAAKTKVRTPLPKLIAVFHANDRDRGALEGQDALAAIIRDELNVKTFEVRDDAEGLVREIVKPDLKVLGPKLGKDLPRVRQALALAVDRKAIVERVTRSNAVAGPSFLCCRRAHIDAEDLLFDRIV